MATKGYGSVSETTPPSNPAKPQDEIIFDELQARVRDALRDVRTKLQNLKEMNKVIGTGKDGKGHREKIKKSIKELLSNMNDVAKHVAALRECRAGSVVQRRVADRYNQEVNELMKDFQRTCRGIEVRQDSNPLASQNPFDDNESDEEAPIVEGHRTGDVLQLEAERRELKERNEAFQALMQDVTDLNSLMKQMAVEVDTQQEGIDYIEHNIDDAAEHVSGGTKQLQKASWLKKKNRKLIIIIICVVIGIVIGVILTIIIAVCVTGHCNSSGNNNSSR